MFFIPFILIATITFLNLFIAIIVNAMQSFNEAEHSAEKTAQELEHAKETALLYQKLHNLQLDLQHIKEQLTKPR